MKRFILILVTSILSLCSINAQTYNYKSTDFCIGNVYPNGIRWGNWEYSNIPITINFSTNEIFIYSKEFQYYSIYQEGDVREDSNGGLTIKCYAYDKNQLRVCIKYRIDPYGVMQLYIIYDDFAFIYNIVQSN